MDAVSSGSWHRGEGPYATPPPVVPEGLQAPGQVPARSSANHVQVRFSPRKVLARLQEVRGVGAEERAQPVRFLLVEAEQFWGRPAVPFYVLPQGNPRGGLVDARPATEAEQQAFSRSFERLERKRERRAAVDGGFVQLASVGSERGQGVFAAAGQLELPQSEQPTPPEEEPNRPVLYRLDVWNVARFVPEEYALLLTSGLLSVWGFTHVAFVENATKLVSPAECFVEPDKKRYDDDRWVEKRLAVAFAWRNGQPVRLLASTGHEQNCSLAPVDFSLKYKRKEYTVAMLFLRNPLWEVTGNGGSGGYGYGEAWSGEPESRFAPLDEVYQSLQ